MIVTQWNWPEQVPQFITENIQWSHQDLQEAPNITIHGHGLAPETENVSYQLPQTEQYIHTWIVSLLSQSKDLKMCEI